MCHVLFLADDDAGDRVRGDAMMLAVVMMIMMVTFAQVILGFLWFSIYSCTFH